MKIVKEHITARQFMFSMLAFVMGSSLLTSFFSDVLKQNTWIGVIVAYLLGLPMIFISLYILSKYPGKSLIEINDILFGRWLGKVFSALYIFYFFTLISLNTYDVCSFIIGYMMPETPPQVVALLFLLVPALLVRRGMDSIARIAPFFCIIQIITMAMFSLFQIKDMHIDNLFPIFRIPVKEFIQGTHTIFALPFGELVSFLMIIPSVDDQKKVRKNMLTAYTVGAVIMLLIVVNEILVLGPALEFFALPSFEAIRLIDLADVISRMDTLYALMLYMLRFYKVSILLYACSLSLAQAAELTQYRPLVTPIAILAALLSIFIHASSVANFEWGRGSAAIYSTFFNVGLPLIAFVVCLIRNAISKRRLKLIAAKA